jgi:hypothetical protein
MALDTNQANPLQETLDLLILKAIGNGELHGLGSPDVSNRSLAAHLPSDPVLSFQLYTGWRKPDG